MAIWVIELHVPSSQGNFLRGCSVFLYWGRGEKGGYFKSPWFLSLND